MDLTENQIKGYCLMSLVSAGMSPEQIRSVMSELKAILDLVSPEEAQKKYEMSPY